MLIFQPQPQFSYSNSSNNISNCRGEKHLRWAAVALSVFLFTSWATTFIIAMKYNYVARVEEPFALFDQLYDKPWLRIGPYLVGMIAGHFLYRVNCCLQMNPFTVTLGWVLSLSCLASLVYGLGREGLVVPASAFYVSYFTIIVTKLYVGLNKLSALTTALETPG